MPRGLFVGLGAVGAVAAGVAGVFVTRGGDAPAATATAAAVRGSAPTVCIESNVRLVEGMARRCLSSAQYDALRDNAVIGGDGGAVVVNLTAPGDRGEAAVARTCAEYDSMAARGWYALTGADMRREEYFKRACGALTMLADAEPARTTHFAGGKADMSDVRSLAMTEAIGFGETRPDTQVDISKVEDGVWKVLIGNGATTIFEIAHADFTGDGVGEILAYMSVGAVDGTARSGVIGLMEKPTAGGGCSFSPR